MSELTYDALDALLLPDFPLMTDVVDLHHRLLIYEDIDSTNSEARRLLDAGTASDGMLLIANHQTAGRGRQGHDFFSPADTGLYVSLIRTDPDVLVPETLSRLTLSAAVATAEAIEETAGVSPQIKWVNDLYYRDKKVCGILTESWDWSVDRPKAVIIGVGINCFTRSFPEDIRETAGSLKDGGIDFIDRNRLAVALWDRLNYWTDHLSDDAMLKEYRARDFLLGKEISFERNGNDYRGLAKGIDDDGKLLVELESALIPKSKSQVLALDSGEVHILGW